MTGTRPWDPDQYNGSANDWVDSTDQPYLYLIMHGIIRGSVDLKEIYTDYMDGIPSLT